MLSNASTLSLSNGVKIPSIGIGTFNVKPADCEKALDFALHNGYRLIDTANAYFNEKAVGRAIKKSSVPREEIFLSTKLWPSVYDDPNGIEQTFERLQVDYIDLLFLHQPAGNFEAGYRNLEKLYNEKRIRAIGISNFEGEKLDKFLKSVDIKPHVIQAEAHPYFPRKELLRQLKPYGISIMGWFPLGHGDQSLMNQEIFTRLGKKYHKSNAQIILRWHVQKGFITIPGAITPEFILANIDVFDFKLTDDEMAEIAKLGNGKRYYDLNEDEYEKLAQSITSFDQE
ncbi:hypothetical protein M9Y10_040162 [Tritrichomonas musculus]|uniref:NADP-dependent oxidoreductase domain-containing protein n=1 Tax=Tritrichomonas musculus TaxID=1915356 RepID=A0ABR2GPT8_9EUKA